MSTLDKINAYSQYYQLHLGMPDEPGWRLATAVVNDEIWLAGHLAQMHVNMPHMPRHAVAMNFYSGYAWYLATAGAACLLTDRRVPDLTAGNLGLKFDAHGWVRGTALLSAAFARLPEDEAADQPNALVLADREALRRHFVTQIWDHLRRLIAGIRAFAPISEQALRIITANTLANTTLWLLQSVNMHAIAESESRAMAADLPFAARLRYFEVECNGERETHLNGTVCCYWYKRADNTKGEYCANCPKVPIITRIDVLRGHMLSRQQGNDDAD